MRRSPSAQPASSRIEIHAHGAAPNAKRRPRHGAVRMSERGAIRPGVSAVVRDGHGRLLLQQRTDNGRWGLPGGAVEYGECVTDALRREVEEETGLVIEVGRLIGVYSDPAHGQIVTYPDGNVAHFVSLCFACSVRSGTLALSDETSGVAWFALDVLPDDLYAMHRIRIEDALTDGAIPFVR